MIEPAIRLKVEAPTLLAFEVWTLRGPWREALDPPAACRAADTERGRILAVEPHVWWLCPTGVGATDAQIRALTEALDGAGAVFDISGSHRRIRIEDPDWRERLAIGGVLDTRPHALPVGAIAASVLHHAPVRLDVKGPATLDLYTPPSFVEHLLHHL